MSGERERALKKFGKALADRRHRNKMTQEQLAQTSGLHANYIGDLERGERNPTLLTLLALAKGMRCRPSELVRDPFS
jgi:HTH-type transcriptional regulator, competence development regulator